MAGNNEWIYCGGDRSIAPFLILMANYQFLENVLSNTVYSLPRFSPALPFSRDSSNANTNPIDFCIV